MLGNLSEGSDYPSLCRLPGKPTHVKGSRARQRVRNEARPKRGNLNQKLFGFGLLEGKISSLSGVEDFIKIMEVPRAVGTRCHA